MERLKRSFADHDLENYRISLADFAECYDSWRLEKRREFSDFYIDAHYKLSYLSAWHNQEEMATYYMKKAISIGFDDYNRVAVDHVFDELLVRGGLFAELLRTQKAGRNYLTILEEGKKYSTDKCDELYYFYHPADETYLKLVKKTLNLDKIAGRGSEVKRAVNVMGWLHKELRHDGAQNDLSGHSGLEKLMYCKANELGLNCRGIATIFHDCMRALNIKSAYITCKPRNLLKMDNDCHVVNQVFIGELQRWIFLDVTMNAFVTDASGKMLNLEEIRSAIINRSALILNPEANWNNCYQLSITEYLYKYMTKNLYRFVIPVLRSGVKEQDGHCLHLLPDGYQESDCSGFLEKELINNFTSNCKAFWTKPYSKSELI